MQQPRQPGHGDRRRNQTAPPPSATRPASPRVSPHGNDELAAAGAPVKGRNVGAGEVGTADGVAFGAAITAVAAVADGAGREDAVARWLAVAVVAGGCGGGVGARWVGGGVGVGVWGGLWGGVGAGFPATPGRV